VNEATPARLYALLMGAVLVIAGVIGFFYNASFGSGDEIIGDDRNYEVFGLLAVNGWHNLVHIATGLLGLIAAGYAARIYALGLGLVYVVIAIWGFLAVENGFGDLLNIIPVNTEDNFLHLIIGLTGLAAGAATPAEERATPAQAA
jgi:hypothetical protein